jgi:hypothetical protein
LLVGNGEHEQSPQLPSNAHFWGRHDIVIGIPERAKSQTRSARREAAVIIRQR